MVEGKKGFFWSLDVKLLCLHWMLRKVIKGLETQ